LEKKTKIAFATQFRSGAQLLLRASLCISPVSLFRIFSPFALKGLGLVCWLRTTGRFPDILLEYLGFRPFVLHRPAAPVRRATTGLNPWHFRHLQTIQS
jgi:hypothetical protein